MTQAGNIYIVLDTETTGLSSDARIVSICWGLFTETGRKIAIKSHIIFPDGYTIPEDASAIHGITSAEARRKGVQVQGLLIAPNDDINHNKPAMYVGHNVSFDRPIVVNEYRRAGIRAHLASLPTYCTMENTTDLCELPPFRYGSYKWPRLEELHRHLFGHVHADAHNAEGDVRACAACYFKLVSQGLGPPAI